MAEMVEEVLSRVAWNTGLDLDKGIRMLSPQRCSRN